jgi:hypothetical protein
MSAQPAHEVDPHEPFEVIHLGGEAAAIVPVAELRRLQALERLATPEELDAAAAAAASEEYQEWCAAGRPGAIPHDVARRILLGDITPGRSSGHRGQ